MSGARLILVAFVGGLRLRFCLFGTHSFTPESQRMQLRSARFSDQTNEPPKSHSLFVGEPFSFNVANGFLQSLAILQLARVPTEFEFVRVLRQVLPAHVMP